MDQPRNELHRIRLELQVTQAAMADTMGVPIRTYEDLEAGRAKLRQVHLNAAWFAAIVFASQEGGLDRLPPDIGQIVERAARRRRKILGGGEGK
jgi:DNA-binding XRE family transcriptional regulator